MPLCQITIRIFFTALLAFAAASASAQFDTAPTRSSAAGLTGADEFQQQTFLKVYEAYHPLVSVDGDQLLVQWNIEPAYYLYRDNFKFELTDGRGKPLAFDLVRSPGEEKEDEFFGRVQVHYFNAEQTLSPLPAQPFTLALTSQGCADAGLCYPPWTLHYRIDPASGAVNQLPEIDEPAADIRAPPQTAANASDASLLLMLLYALLGGAILNLMPCVFPVLGLKVMSFARSESASAPMHGLSYTLGVVLSFVVVAALLIGLKASGQALGWGFQLQTPVFVAMLAILFFVLALAMWGYFEIAGRWMGLGSDASHKDGLSGSFFTGVLAAVVASPCTAPFMGVALGFALTQTTATALLVFAALGLGMALPLLILTLVPAWLEKLPRPGPWMMVLRQALAFPLFAAALWLAWVFGQQTGATAMGLIALVMLLLALMAWAFRFDTQAGRATGWIALAFAGFLLWSNQGLFEANASSAPDDSAWSEQKVAALRAKGAPVFVDVTADWCITCRANEALVLNTDKTRVLFSSAGVVTLVADWTNYDARITELVERYGRGGIPLYLMFPADPQAEAIVLPQILTDAAILKAVEAVRN